MDLKIIKNGTKFFFLGIGGISMSALALILKEKGYAVSGYDRARSAATDKLESAGIKVFYDFSASNADECEIIVYSAAFGKNHEVFKAAESLGKPMYPRAELLGAISGSYANSVAVAGTHGKSTTSGMLGHVFMEADNCDPTVVVGAVMREIGSAYRLGSDENFIYEACEYCDSFLSFYPHIAVVLNIALDHTDYFKDIEQMRDSFTRFMNNAGTDGIALYNLDDVNCRISAEGVTARKVTFSALGDENADYYAKNVVEKGGHSEFDVYRRGVFLCRLKPGAPGKHNISNSLAAFAVCDLSGIPLRDAASGIAGFNGVGRRFEPLGEFCGAKVFDDYAHHPDEIKATLATAREMAGGNKVFCVFQPHNYSRLRDLYDDFKTAFSDCDKLFLCPLYAAREKSDGAVSSQTLAEEIKHAEYCSDYEDITEKLKNELHNGDILVIMGAGDISNYTKTFRK